MLSEKDDSISPRAQLSDVFIIIFDIFGLGARDEELFLYLYCLLLHTTNYNIWGNHEKGLI